MNDAADYVGELFLRVIDALYTARIDADGERATLLSRALVDAQAAQGWALRALVRNVVRLEEDEDE